MKEKPNNHECWEYKTLFRPSEKELTREGMLGWEAYAVTIEPFHDAYSRETSAYVVYLKRRVQKGGAR